MSNPRGQQRDKPFRDALRIETRLAEDGQWDSFKPPKGSLRAIARELLYRGMTDTVAVRELADRLDGKVPQGVGQDPELDAMQLIVTGVARVGDK